MSWSATSLRRLSRRTMLRATGGVVAAAIARVDARSARADTSKLDDPLFRALDDKIEAAMARYHVPGVAVGVLHDGREYVRGYGVTNVDYPLPVDGDTLFRIGSTTKTFTGTAVMRLVAAGKLDLNAPVRRYLPELKLADEPVAAQKAAAWYGLGICGRFTHHYRWREIPPNNERRGLAVKGPPDHALGSPAIEIAGSYPSGSSPKRFPGGLQAQRRGRRRRSCTGLGATHRRGRPRGFRLKPAGAPPAGLQAYAARGKSTLTFALQQVLTE
jgi:hypothetical protein